MSEDEDIRLRDQFAIAAMQSLLGQYKQQISFSKNGSINTNGTEYSKSGSTNSTIFSFESEDNALYLQRMSSKIKLVADLAYKIADEMRKARLKSFT
jgi:hypothetical protein